MTNVKAVMVVAVDGTAIATAVVATAVARAAKVAPKMVKRAPTVRALRDAMVAVKVVAAVDVAATRVARSASVLTPKASRKTWMWVCKPEPRKARSSALNAARAVTAMSHVASAVNADHARDVAANGLKTPSATQQNPVPKAVASNARATRANRHKSHAKRVKAGVTAAGVVDGGAAMTVARGPTKLAMPWQATASNRNWVSPPRMNPQ